MSPLSAILAVLLILSPLSRAASDEDDDTRSAYDVIQDFNFPMGILPKGVTGYELNRSTGQFAAYFDGACSFSLEGSYQLKYKSTITGTISNNRLKDLTGVSVKVLFLWLNIVEVSRSGDDLDFSVGIASASFPIDNFYECPQCGCGLNCSPAPPQLLARHVRNLWKGNVPYHTSWGNIHLKEGERREDEKIFVIPLLSW